MRHYNAIVSGRGKGECRKEKRHIEPFYRLKPFVIRHGHKFYRWAKWYGEYILSLCIFYGDIKCQASLVRESMYRESSCNSKRYCGGILGERSALPSAANDEVLSVDELQVFTGEKGLSLYDHRRLTSL